MKATKIYLDMDGVIADFVKRYKELYHMDPREAEKKKEFDKYFHDFIDKQSFATLDVMPGAVEAMIYLKNLHIPTEILSSTAKPEYHEEISKQKKIWLETNGVPFKANFVPGKKNKYKYATPSSIIIDDTYSVIEDWRNAGGIGIWHKDWATTLAILRMYI